LLLSSSSGRKAFAEFLGTGVLVTVVVGSGTMAAKLSSDNGVELLLNALSTVLALALLIFVLAPISGAHFNPVVTLSEFFQGHISLRETSVFIVAECAGGVAGTVAANLMFKNPAIFQSHHLRNGAGVWLGEVIATAGLLGLIQFLRNLNRTNYAPVVIAGWIGSAYLFTSSTSFVNPAVTFSRAFSNTFSGISLSSVPGFVAAQCIGALIGTLVGNYLSQGSA
jgi:glycerol uptake facilitator-like aquaporin